MKPKKEYNPNLVRSTWRTQPRDKNGHFIKERRKADNDKRIVIDSLSFLTDLSDEKIVSNTTIPPIAIYSLEDIRKAYFEGANTTRMYSLVKQWEIYCKKNNLS